MTFHISVYRIADRELLKERPPTDIGALYAWMADRPDLTVFDEFLGANWAIGDHWSDHAERLGLPILASLYEVGFTHGVQVEGAGLDALESELDQLVAEWRRLYPPPDEDGGQDPQPLTQLLERADHMRTAIRIARQVDGFIDIG
ncbi:hypothetical protein AB0B66_09380 [Catellatospora sp. NPDC049111]|uniref:hypothetical protein n=1 Tax=Catellatospora sp. NPDC049111 TaxID=3155271 RepID=UPI0033F1704F